MPRLGVATRLVSGLPRGTPALCLEALGFDGGRSREARVVAVSPPAERLKPMPARSRALAHELVLATLGQRGTARGVHGRALARCTAVRRVLGLLVVAVCLLACRPMGARTIPTARFDYNDAVVRSFDHQMLLNLVRLRYQDSIFFLDLTSIV